MKVKNVKLPIITAVIAASLLLSGTNLAFAQTNPSAKVVAIAPTSVANVHSVVFQVCAGSDTNMRAPEVIVRSLAEVKTVNLSKIIAKGTCTTSATQMTAFDPNNIKIKVIDKSNLNRMVDSAERKLINVKSQIAATNDDLQALIENIPGNNPTKATEISKIGELSGKLVELRKELKDSRSEYYRLLYMLKA